MQKCAKSATLAVSLVLVSVASAHAQLYEDVGTRAQGMAGAFVALADDATASWWNPAGLASGAFFNLTIEKGRASEPENPTGLEPARRLSTTAVSVAFPSLGLSYYRLRVSQIAPVTSIETTTPNRQLVGGPGSRVRSLAAAQLGLTVGQSVGNHFVVGTTLKLVRGGAASAVVDGSTNALDVGDDLVPDQRIHGDLDVGAMLSFPAFKAGLSVRNLTEPDLGEGSDVVTLERQARAGVALFVTPRNALASLSITADADLTKTTSPFGDVRHAALGGETWLLGKRVGLRAGVATNTIGERRTTTSTGVSVGITKGLYIDGARTFGEDDSTRGWSSTVRFTF